MDWRKKVENADLKAVHDLKVNQNSNQTVIIPSSIMKYSQANIFSDNGEDASDLKPSISVYGDLNLDEDEKEALQMDPKFAVLDPLSPEDFEVEIELCISKQKWNRMSRAGIKSWRTVLYIKKKKRSPFRGLWQDEFFVDSLLLCFSLIVVVQALKCQEK